jgi:hypothetical protein
MLLLFLQDFLDAQNPDHTMQTSEYDVSASCQLLEYLTSTHQPPSLNSTTAHSYCLTMSSIESIRSMTVDSPLSTKAPEYFVRLIQVHLVSKKFKNHLVRVKGQIGIYEHETMGVRYKYLNPEGSSWPKSRGFTGHALYRSGGYIASDPAAFAQVEGTEHEVSFNGSKLAPFSSQQHPLTLLE